MGKLIRFIFAVCAMSAMAHAVFSVVVPSASAASTRVEWSNSSDTLLGDFFGNPLKSGTSADYDGSRLQLGYYDLATAESPFMGDWVPLTGLASDFSPTTIGDKGDLGNGRFRASSTFDLRPSSNLPAGGVPLSIRFYDSFSPSASTFYNAVSNGSGVWNWITPTEPQSVLTISLTDMGIIWQDGAGSAFKTTIDVVPEPAPGVLLAIGIGLAVGGRVFLRRNRCKA